MKAKDAAKSFDDLKKELKSGDFKQAYLLYGEERLLKLDFFKKICKLLGGEVGDMNTTLYEGKNINVGAVIDQAETLPIFAERRIIMIQDSGLFKSGGEQLAEYVKDICESTTFIFCESDVDERSKLYKAVKEKGTVAEIGPQGDNYLRTYIAGYLNKEGKRITTSCAERIIAMTGSDLARLRSELEKLVCYCIDKEVIELEDVETICSVNIEDRVFDMINAIFKKQSKHAMELYYDLLALKEAPIKILSLIERHINILLITKELRENGVNVNEIPSKAGFQPFFLNNYLNQSSGYTVSELRALLEQCVSTDEAIKSGKISGDLGVETLLICLGA